MVDVSALIVAIVSLVGTFLVAIITLAYQYFSDKRKVCRKRTSCEVSYALIGQL